jgi:hypothetical protein
MPQIPHLAGTWISGKYVIRQPRLESNVRVSKTAQFYFNPMTACITGFFFSSNNPIHLGSMDAPRAYCEAFNNIQESKFLGNVVRLRRTVPWGRQDAAQTGPASLC